MEAVVNNCGDVPEGKVIQPVESVGTNRLIGEDLGVVPDYVRPSLASLGIAGFKIPIWENGPDGRLTDGKKYQRLSLVTYATHDHPPLKTMWNSLETAARGGDGHALWELRRIAEFAGIAAPMPQPFSEEIHTALLEALLRSNSWIAVMMITDFFGSEQRFNVPGAVADSNWSERLPQPVSHWSKDAEIARKAEAVRLLLLATDRHEV